MPLVKLSNFPNCFFPPTVPRSHSDSESEYSASNSEDDEGVAQEYEEDTNAVVVSQKIEAQNRVVSAPVCKETPSKKMKREKTVSEERDLRLKEKLSNTTKPGNCNRRNPYEDQHSFWFLFLLFCVFSFLFYTNISVLISGSSPYSYISSIVYAKGNI